MSADTSAVTRDEFWRLSARLESIDAGGTRGVAVLAVQIQEIAKDFAKHEERHERQEAARAQRVRWMIGAAVALVGAVDGPIVAVLLAMHGH